MRTLFALLAIVLLDHALRQRGQNAALNGATPAQASNLIQR